MHRTHVLWLKKNLDFLHLLSYCYKVYQMIHIFHLFLQFCKRSSSLMVSKPISIFKQVWFKEIYFVIILVNRESKLSHIGIKFLIQFKVDLCLFKKSDLSNRRISAFTKMTSAGLGICTKEKLNAAADDKEKLKEKEIKAERRKSYKSIFV